MARDIGRNLKLISMEMPYLNVTLPPLPWKRQKVHPVGGLREVGFGSGSDLLLVISTQGRGVVDCLTGERVARDSDSSLSFLNEFELLAEGIGPLNKQQVRVAGWAGGGLAASTADRWHLETQTYEWPECSVFLKSPDYSEYTNAAKGVTKVCADSTLVATGFSPTGNSFAIATSSDLTVYSRMV